MKDWDNKKFNEYANELYDAICVLYHCSTEDFMKKLSKEMPLLWQEVKKQAEYDIYDMFYEEAELLLNLKCYKKWDLFERIIIRIEDYEEFYKSLSNCLDMINVYDLHKEVSRLDELAAIDDEDNLPEFRFICQNMVRKITNGLKNTAESYEDLIYDLDHVNTSNMFLIDIIDNLRENLNFDIKICVK